MNESAAYTCLPTTYDDFLFARVRTDAEGGSTSVLSILACRNLDPWDEAAKLSRLPRAMAATVLTAFIGSRADTLHESDAEAFRLVSLLAPAEVSIGTRAEAFRGSSESGGVGFAICLFCFVLALGAIGAHRLDSIAGANGHKDAPVAEDRSSVDVLAERQPARR